MYESAKVAEIIKKLAKSKNIALKDLFESAGMGRNTMSHMVNGSMPKADNLARIAERLDCTVDYLLGKNDEPETDDDEIDINNIQFALSKATGDPTELTETDIEDVKTFVRFIKDKRKKNK